ncbi:MAG: STAS domain-containing protein [Spirochaetota bacterium]|jgi:anti-anti-sigma factor|nr:STAS domain-containing protein [Spirochaetota bacterium]
MQSGEYLYSLCDKCCVLKLVGSLTYSESGDLDGFIEKLFEASSAPDVIVDLSEAKSIDSTNLGLLARIARASLDQKQRKTLLVSPRPDINRVLKSVGFDGVFDIVRSSEAPGGGMDKLPHRDISDQELAGILLKVHRTLMELNESNRAVFKNVVRYLEKEIEAPDTAAPTKKRGLI